MSIVVNNDTFLSNSTNGRKTDFSSNDWATHAEQLADWTLSHLFARTDTFPEWDVPAEDWRRRFQPLAYSNLLAHFEGVATLGSYTLGEDNCCKYIGWDVDAHDDQADPDLNWEYSLTKYKQLRGLGFHPILEDSNGSGGYHLWTILGSPIDGAVAYSFGRWLVRDLDVIRAKPEEERTKNEKRLATLTVEVFPKQQSLEKGGFGNQLRLPGKHHKKSHWSRFYDGTKWLEGRDAAEYLLSLPLTSAEKIPSSARSYSPPKSSSPPTAALGSAASVTGEEWWKRYSGDLKTLDILALCEDRLTGKYSGGAHEIICPWCVEHTTGDGGAFVWEAEDDKWPGFHCHHAHCEGRTLADLLGVYGADNVDQNCAENFDTPRSSRQVVGHVD